MGDDKTRQNNYEVYFKLTVTFNAKTSSLTKRNKSKFLTLDMKFSKTSKGKERKKKEGIELLL
jgi:hypothetical protein